MTVGNPPRIAIEDIVLDLAAAEDDVGRAVTWVTTAVQSRLTTPARIRRAMQARHFVRHRRFLERLLNDVAEGVRSALELSYLHDVERAHGLPVGQRQQVRRRTETDVWYEEFGLLVELDGKVGHIGRGRFRGHAPRQLRDKRWASNVAIRPCRCVRMCMRGGA